MILVIVSSLNRRGMALYPFVFLKNKSDIGNKVLINHEKIHLRQQIELLVVPFYIIYVFHYLVNLFSKRNHHAAYIDIVFEKEAYAKESDFDYLRKRKIWDFVKYF